MKRLCVSLLVVLCALLPSFAEAETCSKESFDCTYGECVHGHCQCKEGEVGVGGLGCYESGYEVCWSINDPTGRTLSGQKVDLYFPCRFRMVKFDAKKMHGDTEAVCEIEVLAANDRYKGKWAAGQFEVLVSYTERVNASGTVTQQNMASYSFRANGTAMDGSYDFTMESRPSTKIDDVTGYSEYVPGSINIRNPGDVDFHKDNDDKRVSLVLESCGLKLHFMPADIHKGKKQLLLPGIILGVDTNNFDVEYSYEDVSFCMNPDADIKGLILKHGISDASDAMVFDLFRAGEYSLNSPFVPGNVCDDAANVDELEGATTSIVRPHAMDLCKNFIHDAHLISCFHKEHDPVLTENLVQMYGDCMELATDFSSVSDSLVFLDQKCNGFKKLVVPVIDAGCAHRLPFSGLPSTGQVLDNAECSDIANIINVSFPDLYEEIEKILFPDQ